MMLQHGTQAKVGDVMSDSNLRRAGYIADDSGAYDQHTCLTVKETTPGRWETYFECCNRMVGFNNTVKEAAKIYTAIYENYGDRARKAKNNEGIDWKALSHAVRVGYEAIELLTTGKITFPFTGERREHLLDIKLGRLPYQVIAEEIERLEPEVEAAAEKSSLPEDVDRDFIDGLVEDMYRGVVFTSVAF